MSTLRTVSLPKDEFDKQIGGGLWRISITARAGGGGVAGGSGGGRAGSPNCAEPLCPTTPSGRQSEAPGGLLGPQ